MSTHAPGSSDALRLCGCTVDIDADNIWYCPLHFAAPELLEALEYVIGAHSIVHAQGWIERAKALTQARAAIVKTRGKTK